MKKAKIVIIAAIILSIIALVLVLAVRAGADGKTDSERALEEIVGVYKYRWERYAYTVQDAKLVGEQKQGARHYIVTVYAADEETLCRYEFICSVTDDDVDFELLRKETCDDY